MMRIILLIFVFCKRDASGFSSYKLRHTSSISKQPRITTPPKKGAVNSPLLTLLYSSPSDKQAEILALEEKLRQLKEETQNEQVLDSDEEEETEWVIMKGQTNDSVMLSERWKESDPSSNTEGNNVLKNVASVIGLAVFLAIFSQVPVGQEDLQKYQDVKGSASRIDLGDLNPDVRVQI
ncbi:hypothetical protein HJC23_007002 [Cyclotella cryptica]|uniref:Uncharacterized protein n=1 Tax=Cyclotella cryptica TaxID=29204 RepID=A0ABD3QMH3_9STRA